MSVTVKQGIRPKTQPGKGAARFWKLFPHLLLCLSLVAYAAVGAVMFQHIEGASESPTKAEYYGFLGEIVNTVQNFSYNASHTHQNIVDQVEAKMRSGFKSIWLQRRERWDFFGSMFFCCTVFTTVGYGEIYPVTLLGKVACVLYAMGGIPLMLLVILDVGNFLAMFMSRAYIRVQALCKTLYFHIWSSWKAQNRSLDSNQQALKDGTIIFSHDIVTHEPLDIRHVLHSQAVVQHKFIVFQKKLCARENLLRKGSLHRSLSCPELDQLPPPPKGYDIWDLSNLGDGQTVLDVPFVLILLIMFAYIFLGGLILPLWETKFKGFDPYYFCFITLTTIGFGDIVPNHPKYFMLTSLFIIIGMAIMSMSFQLSQTRIVKSYRQCMKFISRGNIDFQQ